MQQYIEKAGAPVSGFLLGYASAHVLIQYVLVQLIFTPFGLPTGRGWKTNIAPAELICVIVLGAVLRMVFRADDRRFHIAVAVGAALWLVVAVLK